MREWLPQAVALTAAALLGSWLTLRVRRFWERRRGRERNLKGQRGEQDAERLLLAHGYRIVDRQKRVTYDMAVAAEPQTVTLLLDFVVERNGTRWVAEVKTGQAAALANMATRRQLLEYQLATHSTSVLLVDPDAGEITEVAFPRAVNVAPRTQSWWPLPAAIALLLAIAWWFSRS